MIAAVAAHGVMTSIVAVKCEDFALTRYECDPTIKVPIAIQRGCPTDSRRPRIKGRQQERHSMADMDGAVDLCAVALPGLYEWLAAQFRTHLHRGSGRAAESARSERPAQIPWDSRWRLSNA